MPTKKTFRARTPTGAKKTTPATPTPTPKPLGGIPSPAGPPLVVQGVLWLFLVGWLVLLTVNLLDNDPPKSIPMLKKPSKFLAARVAAEREAEERVLSQRSRPSSAPQPPANSEIEALKVRVASELLKGNMYGARNMIIKQQQDPQRYPYQAELSVLARFVADVDGVNMKICRAIMDNVGLETVVTLNGKRHTIIPLAVAGTRVQYAVTGSQGTSAPDRTFDVAELSAMERAQLLGPMTTPAVAAMKLMLNVEAKQFPAARACASQCGAMSKAFITALETVAMP